MTKLSTIRKQIAALEAQAAAITREEMGAAIGKVRALMSEFGLTVEHLTHSVSGKAATAKSKATRNKSSVKKPAAAAKYADPKSGKTWSGFGRAPGWIANAKNRDAFLVGTGSQPAVTDVPTAPSTRKATAKKSAKTSAAPAKKAAKTVARKAKSVKKSTAPAKKAASKKVAPAKKTGSKRPVAKKVATPTSATADAPSAATVE